MRANNFLKHTSCLNISFKFVVDICISLSLLGGCTNVNPKLDYNSSPDQILFYETYREPMVFGFYETCLYIPEARVWGDGRVVSLTYQNDQRVVNTGYLTKDEIHAYLVEIKGQGFFDPAATEMINQAGGGFSLRVSLTSGSYGHNVTEQFYQLLFQTLKSPNIKVFTPERGYMVAQPSVVGPTTNGVPPWPQEYGFSLADVVKQGRWIDGPIAAFVWNIINIDPVWPVMSDHGQIYMIGLEIPGISEKDPPFDCWSP